MGFEHRPPGPAPFGDDLDDPIGGLGAVDRGGRGPFEHLDGLDLLGVQVVDAGGRLAAEVLKSLGRYRRLVVDPDAVDVQERLIGKAQASGTADPGNAPGADRPGRPDDPDAGHVDGQHILELGGWREDDGIGDVDFADRVAEAPRRRFADGPGDDEFVKLDRQLDEFDPNRSAADRHWLGPRLETEALEGDLGGRPSQPGEGELASCIGDCPGAGALNPDHRVREQPPRPRFDHGSGNRSGLTPGSGRRKPG